MRFWPPLIPSLLVNLISESMNQAWRHADQSEGNRRQGAAQQLLSSSMLWMCVLLIAASAVMALTARGFFR